MNNEYLIVNGNVITPLGIIASGGVRCLDGRIVEILQSIQEPISNSVKVIDAQKYNIMAGFIDQHLHGANGFDVMDGGAQSIINIAYAQLRFGVTSFCPTTIACSNDKLINTLNDIAYARKTHLQFPIAQIIGAHIEGPFLNEQKAGAHPKKYLQNPSSEKLWELIDSSVQNTIRIITLAPELPNAMEAISQISKSEIVISLGHSVADYDTTLQAIKSGARCITHLFNAMEPLHHRSPGMIGAGFSDKNVMIELIGDGRLVHPEVVRTALRVVGVDRIILISDSLSPTGNDSITKFYFGERELYVRDGCCSLEDGTIWGSNTPLNEIANNVMTWLNLNLVDMSKLISLNSAKLLGLSHQKGSIEIGKDADIVICDNHFNIKMVMVGGKVGFVNQDFELI